MRVRSALLCAALGAVCSVGWARNVVVFVADGLRPGSVTALDAPTLSALRDQGVSFTNSHALFPTVTTANASAIATGHYLGDTGDFGNDLYVGYRLFETRNFARAAASPVGFDENDAMLGDLDAHYGGNYLGAMPLLAAARAAGYGTAAVGKLGPVAIQDIAALQPQAGNFAVPATVIIDDSTGAAMPPLAPGVPLASDVSAALAAAGLPLIAPTRVQPAGNARTPGTQVNNREQQDYFVQATTRVVLPLLRQRGKPFVLVFWSRDPDGSQHNQGDSLNTLRPGVNGPTSRAGVRNADDDLRQILDYLHADPALAADTDVFVTSDHGFATVSKSVLDAHGTRSHAYSAGVHYADVPTGFLPPGFVAIDLAHALDLPLYDLDSPVTDAQGASAYRRVVADTDDAAALHHPTAGHALIGGAGLAGGDDAHLIVTANGGSDLIYVQHADPAEVRRVVGLLTQLDYVSALFVADQYAPVPGALPLSAIGLVGAAQLPRPAIVVSFRTFVPGRQSAAPAALQNAVLIADTTLQQGQGTHGSFARDNTFNFMAAIGPDFRAKFRDPLPVGNADLAPTLLHLLGLTVPAQGALVGRVLEESLSPSVPSAGVVSRCLLVSTADAAGQRTELRYQRYQGRLYLDRAERLRRPAAAGSGGGPGC